MNAEKEVRRDGRREGEEEMNETWWDLLGKKNFEVERNMWNSVADNSSEVVLAKKLRLSKQSCGWGPSKIWCLSSWKLWKRLSRFGRSLNWTPTIYTAIQKWLNRLQGLARAWTGHRLFIPRSKKRTQQASRGVLLGTSLPKAAPEVDMVRSQEVPAKSWSLDSGRDNTTLLYKEVHSLLKLLPVQK